MPNHASATIVGHLGRDAELKYTNSGDPVVGFSMAVNQRNGKDETVVWYKCSMFGKRGEAVKQYLTKGKAVMVIGGLNVREWKDKEGAVKTSVEIRVNELVLLGDGQKSDPKPKPQKSMYEADGDDRDIPF